MRDRDDALPPREADRCYICGQPAGGGEMEGGAHVLCAWGLTDQERCLKQTPKRRGFFPSIEALEAERAE